MDQLCQKAQLKSATFRRKKEINHMDPLILQYNFQILGVQFLVTPFPSQKKLPPPTPPLYIFQHPLNFPDPNSGVYLYCP